MENVIFSLLFCTYMHGPQYNTNYYSENGSSYFYQEHKFLPHSAPSWILSLAENLARWSHRVTLFLEDPGHPATLPTANV